MMKIPDEGQWWQAKRDPCRWLFIAKDTKRKHFRWVAREFRVDDHRMYSTGIIRSLSKRSLMRHYNLLPAPWAALNRIC